MARAISETFLNSLLNGKLHDLLELVQKDDTLQLELRGKSVIVYYRGGKLLEVEETAVNRYRILPGDEGYNIGNRNYPHIIFEENQIERDMLEEYVRCFKQIIDLYFGSKSENASTIPSISSKRVRYSLENEIRQHLERENNTVRTAGQTDYFIIDVEYENAQGKKFDIVAVEWPNITVKRKLQKGYCPRLVIFELKYAKDSIKKRKCGIRDHAKDFDTFVSDSEQIEKFKNDMVSVFRQKRQLGLIPYFVTENKNNVKAFDANVDFMFIIANYNLKSTMLKNEIAELPSFKMIQANFMGYGLYCCNILNQEETLKLLDKCN